MPVKIVFGLKDGKSVQKEFGDEILSTLKGKKIADSVKGDDLSLPGYDFLITGGSDNAGFPMRKDITGTERKKILAVSGVGIKKGRHGERQRKTVCGNTVNEKIAQINMKVVKVGTTPLVEEKPAAEGDKK